WRNLKVQFEGSSRQRSPSYKYIHCGPMARRTTPRRRFKEAVDEWRREVGRPGGSNAPGPPSTGARVLGQYAREERRRPGCRRAAWAFEIRRHFFNSLLVSRSRDSLTK